MQWLESDFADACDFELIGLGSHLSPHRLTWELNGLLGWNLEFFKVLNVPQRKESTDHMVYSCVDESQSQAISVALIENRTPTGVLARFQGAAQLDYLIKIGEGGAPGRDWLARLKASASISYAQMLDPLNSGAIEHLALLDLAATNSLHLEGNEEQ
tara:strand:- start:2907 stop:3377 length:471 start_codon:yes stop_codon:yes gene_type:complete